MKLTNARYLLDLNVLLALAEEDHQNHAAAERWFAENGSGSWGTCALTEAGFIRVMANARTLGYTVNQAAKVLAMLVGHPNHRYWQISDGWNTLTAPFQSRIFGHQQVTDALLLGLAVKENGVLVTFDKGLRHMAGTSYAKNLLVLEGEER